MLEIKYLHGSQNSIFELDPVLFVDDLFETRTNLSPFIGGRVATIDTSGYIRLAINTDNAKFVGFIINDAKGYEYENVPAIGSGKCPIAIGGGCVITDQVVETDLVAGDDLYITATLGLLSKTPVAEGQEVFAKVIKGNSSTDKSTWVIF